MTQLTFNHVRWTEAQKRLTRKRRAHKATKPELRKVKRWCTASLKAELGGAA